MFEKHRAKVAQEQYLLELSQWQLREQWAQHCVEACQNYVGGNINGLVLAAGERGMYSVSNASLMTERHEQGHYTGTSSGFSIPVGSLGGHSVRYHVGASRGHYVQGPLVEAAVDVGTLCVTDRRIVFVGSRATKECLFDKLVSCTVSGGELVVGVSNRQKNLVVGIGVGNDLAVEFYVNLAMAHHRGTVDAVLASAQAELAVVEKQKPVAVGAAE